MDSTGKTWGKAVERLFRNEQLDHPGFIIEEVAEAAGDEVEAKRAKGFAGEAAGPQLAGGEMGEDVANEFGREGGEAGRVGHDWVWFWGKERKLGERKGEIRHFKENGHVIGEFGHRICHMSHSVHAHSFQMVIGNRPMRLVGDLQRILDIYPLLTSSTTSGRYTWSHVSNTGHSRQKWHELIFYSVVDMLRMAKTH